MNNYLYKKWNDQDSRVQVLQIISICRHFLIPIMKMRGGKKRHIALLFLKKLSLSWFLLGCSTHYGAYEKIKYYL